MAKPDTETVKDCRYPWTWMHLTSDGGVKPCCFATSEIGNLSDVADVDEIWNGPIAVELRAFIKRNEVHRICRNAACKYVENMSERKPDPN
jgi:MoaA/NifB/PqqE/SkfB family radical SAM enzyme